MTAKELRQSAELYLSGEGTSRQRFEAFEKMANYILANVQEDGEEEIEKSEIECYLEIVHEDNDGYWTFATKELWFRPKSASSLYIPFTTTRSQFRSLMQGLGIEPKKSAEKSNAIALTRNTGKTHQP